jgi:hypothetical protein
MATVSPVGLTASIAAVFRTSTDELARATGVESTGPLVSLASWVALVFS